MKRFNSLLVANRGEIAVRIMRTAKALGYRVVAVYSEADVDAPHVAMADEAVLIGPSPAAESYLDVDKVLDAIKQTGADAVHPGYGFLSENAAFASTLLDAGIAFIGPPPPAIRRRTAGGLARPPGTRKRHRLRREPVARRGTVLAAGPCRLSHTAARRS